MERPDGRTLNIIRKRATAENLQAAETHNFVLSTEAPDHYGDSITQSGWDLSVHEQNPIALFAHDHNWPIGTWKNVRVENRKLVGTLKMAPVGTSSRTDELIRLVDAGILRAVSVGFRPLEQQPMPNGNGYRYTKALLLEASLVAVPAHSQALKEQQARLGISARTMKLMTQPSKNASLAERQDFARHSLVSAETQRKIDEIRRTSALYRDEYTGLSSDEITRRELARMRRDEVRKDISLRARREAEIQMAQNHRWTGGLSPEQIVRDQLQRAAQREHDERMQRSFEETVRYFQEYDRKVR